MTPADEEKNASNFEVGDVPDGSPINTKQLDETQNRNVSTPMIESPD
jgi:hypothetical protein